MPTPIANAIELVAFASAHPDGCVQYWVDETTTRPVLEHFQCALNFFDKRYKKGEYRAVNIVGYDDAGDANEHSLRDVSHTCTECGAPLYPET